jgi:hypothetical protein
MNIDQAFPSQYLKASDLAGAQPIVTIERLEFEPVGQKKEMKPILYFTGKDKGMVLNKTNARNIAHLVGTGETDEWVGARIRLYSANVEFQGEMVDSIRVKAAPPANWTGEAKQAPVAPPPVKAPISDEDIPF